MFIDNSVNASAIAITVAPSNTVVYVPPYSQAFYPILSAPPGLQLQATSAGAVVVQCQLLNFSPELMVWSVQGQGTVTNTVNVQGTVTATPQIAAYTNRSGSVAVANTSQALMGANGARKRLIIENPSSPAGQNIANVESLFINFTAAAGVDDGTSFEILPGGIFDSGLGPVSSEAVTVNAATAGHRYIAREM
jgi:hypothetical protein